MSIRNGIVKPYIDPTLARWDMFIDELIKTKWDVGTAYTTVYPKVKDREVAWSTATTLLGNQRFIDRFNELQRTKYGINEQTLREFWRNKMFKAKKEENALRASENIGRTLGMFKEEAPRNPIININIVMD